MSSCRVTSDNSSSETEFLIQVNASFATGEPSTRHYFFKKRHLLTDCMTYWNEISSMLSEIGVPHHAQPDKIHKIYDFVCEIVDESSDMDIETYPLIVLNVYVGQEPVLDEYVVTFVPTEKSAIEDMLEMVKVEGSEYACSVCLEEISNGSEATRMPCSHVYHETCIVNWLEKSNLCPLCRFKMPAKDAEILEDEELLLEDEEIFADEEQSLEDEEIFAGDEQSLEDEEFPEDGEKILKGGESTEDEAAFLQEALVVYASEVEKMLEKLKAVFEGNSERVSGVFGENSKRI